MKSFKILAAMVTMAACFTACNAPITTGHNYADTSTFGGLPSNRDTSTPTKVTGDAGIMDNSGAGGTKIKKAYPLSTKDTTASTK